MSWPEQFDIGRMIWEKRTVKLEGYHHQVIGWCDLGCEIQMYMCVDVKDNIPYMLYTQYLDKAAIYKLVAVKQSM